MRGSAWGTPALLYRGGVAAAEGWGRGGGQLLVEDDHAHSSDKHADAHIRAPPHRHSAIIVFVCYHISSGHAAPPRPPGVHVTGKFRGFFVLVCLFFQKMDTQKVRGLS